MSNNAPISSDSLDLRRFVRSVRRLKWIYLASFLFFMTLAAVYCMVRQPQYEIRAAVLIEDPSGDGLGAAGGMASMMRTFSVGGFGASSVNNELQLINSHDVLLNTARTLGLNRTYTLRDGLSKEMLFLNSPIAVEAPQQMLDTLSKAMRIRVEIDGDKADIKVTRGFFNTVLAEKKGTVLPATVDTPFGPLQVLRTAHYTGSRQTIDVSLGSYESAADFLTTDIDVDVPDKMADAISFEMLYPNRDRGRAILNTIISEYNAKRLDRKHSTARTQLEFLDGRINAIFGELTEAEQNLQNFKTENKIVNIEAEAPLLLESAYTAQTDMVKVSAEVAYYREVLSTLSSPALNNELLPVFDSEAYPMIKDYNTMLMEKKDLERSATPSNPVLIKAEANLAEMRSSVMRNVESMLQASETLLASQRALAAKADAKLNTLPAAERDYIVLLRDQQIKNELYSYLAAQRENAALQIYNQETLGFVVDEAYSSIKPSKKKAILAIIGCLFMALFCPTCIAVVVTLRHRRITDPMDLASAGLEASAVVLDGSKDSANQLRTIIMERGRGLKLYICGDAAAEAIADLAKAFGAIDRPTALLTPEDMNLPSDNDSLLLPAFQQRMARILTETDTEALMVKVPDADRVTELAPAIVAGSSSLLIMAYRSGSLAISNARSVTVMIKPSLIIFALFRY